MLKPRLFTSRGEKLADRHYPWPRLSGWLTLLLFVITVMVILTICLSGPTNEPVWPGPGALHLALAHRF
jgi:hypothetical protein